MDRLTPEQRRRNMQAIKSTNTKIELLLGKSLWKLGYRYRKNNRRIYGKPDFTLKKYKLAIFCDSEFWHGKDWEVLNKRLQTNRAYWVQKIERNIQRDKQVNEKLDAAGWYVMRFWEKEIVKDLSGCITQIENKINLLKTQNNCI